MPSHPLHLLTLFGRTTLLLAIFLNGLCYSSASYADPTELEVYTDELTDKGEFNMDMAGNTSQSARKSEQHGRAVSQAVGEFSYGVTEQLSTSVKLPVSFYGGTWYGNGALAEVKYIASHETNGFYWGAEVEAGYLSPLLEARQWELELTPILGYRNNDWHVVINPGVSLTSRGDEHGEFNFEPSAKLAYRLDKNDALGMEYFVQAGAVDSLLPRNRRNEIAFLAWDTKIAKSTINLGLGHGTTDASPRWVGKLIVDLEFD